MVKIKAAYACYEQILFHSKHLNYLLRIYLIGSCVFAAFRWLKVTKRSFSTIAGSSQPNKIMRKHNLKVILQLQIFPGISSLHITIYCRLIGLSDDYVKRNHFCCVGKRRFLHRHSNYSRRSREVEEGLKLLYVRVCSVRPSI